MQKRIYIIIIAVLFVGCLVLGRVCISTGKRAANLDRESGELRKELADSGERIEYLESEYSRIARENAALRKEISDGLAGIYDGASNLEKRLQDITEEGAGLSERMRNYLPKANPPD